MKRVLGKDRIKINFPKGTGVASTSIRLEFTEP